MSTIDLIAGVPGSGKTTFGDYLRNKKGYVHIDLEAFQGSFHHRIWEIALQSPCQIDLFTQTLEREGKPVVLTWGFHPSDLKIVAELKKSGVTVWWFDADAAAAEEAFCNRGTIPVENFRAQMSRIKDAQTRIAAVIENRTITVLKSGGVRMSPSAIWDEMNQKRYPA